MKLIVGLGNPGAKYENTRHNTGFQVMDEIAKELCINITQQKFQALIATTQFQGEKVMCMKPQTFMNLSGEAVGAAMRFYHLSLSDLLVIYDDKDIPVGKIRLREKGSSGGQNGVKNIIAHVGSENWNRIRVGIGKDPTRDMVDWVLGTFSKEETPIHHQAICMAKDAAIYSITHSFMDTMNRFNQRMK